ncbi:hypothetical protein BHE74_00038397 [Ensete ventricosum]|nr:hypothetical protein GW17_00057858 [Ensete ventricosum]RWW54986.1 hypothetical protein BHE74_00038397 [Ensete ventricosum]
MCCTMTESCAKLTKVTQLAEVKLRSEGLSMGQEDTETGTLEEYATVVERGKKATMSPKGLSYAKVKHRSEMRWTRRNTTVPQRQIYQLRRKGRRFKATDSTVMGLAAPWYHKGGTSIESSILCSHGERALVVKGTEEVEIEEANSKYYDKTEG